jgi:predicted ATPase
MPVRVRMGLHTGVAEWRDGEYLGYLTLVRVQRIMSVSFGGQVLLSQTTKDLAQDMLSAGITLRDLGEHQLKGLGHSERLWQVVAADLPHEFPALKSLNAIPNNLPAQLTSFIGREQEMAEIKRLLAANRLLTLTGSGGTGKTRLSIQTAAEVLDQFPDGVWLVELAPLADPVLVSQLAAATLRLREEPGSPVLATLTTYLAEQQLLLMLDNCEHLVAACAHLADAILRAAPRVKILASSRELLGIAGETVYHVPPLATPNPAEAAAGLAAAQSGQRHGLKNHLAMPLERYASVRLFIDRATQAHSTFRLSEANAPAVAQICYRLDGIPLAIELAATRVRTLSAEQIATRLDDRFRLLTGGSRTALPHHRTLHALIDWSYNLLNEPERRVFNRLSVFAGGWTLVAAEAVCSSPRSATGNPTAMGRNETELTSAGSPLAAEDVLDLLASLADKSLIVAGGEGSDTRFSMLETIRAVAHEGLQSMGEHDTRRQHHAEYFAQWSADAEPGLNSAGQAEWLGRLDAELDNLREALRWTLDVGHVETAAQIMSNTRGYWVLRGYLSEGLRWLEGLLSRWALLSPSSLASTLGVAANIAVYQGDHAPAQGWLDEAIQLGRSIGDKASVAYALGALSMLMTERGDYQQALALFEQNLVLYRELGNTARMALMLSNIGAVAQLMGNHERAQAAYEESLALARELGNPPAQRSRTLMNLGELAHLRGDPDRAASLYLESLRLCYELGDWLSTANCLECIASLDVLAGSCERATGLFGAIEGIRERVGTRRNYSDPERYPRDVQAARAQLVPTAFAAAWARGPALMLEQAVALALEERHS